MSADRLERFQKLAETHPDNVLFRFSLGQALLQNGRGAEAIPHLRQAADSKADWMMARIFLGQALAAEGKIGEARPVMEEALQLAVSQGHEDPERELREWLSAHPA